MTKYILIYSDWYKKRVYRLTVSGQYVPNSYMYSFAFSKQEAIENVNAMRQVSRNIRQASK